jgi:hypothetical protein
MDLASLDSVFDNGGDSRQLIQTVLGADNGYLIFPAWTSCRERSAWIPNLALWRGCENCVRAHKVVTICRLPGCPDRMVPRGLHESASRALTQGKILSSR